MAERAEGEGRPAMPSKDRRSRLGLGLGVRGVKGGWICGALGGGFGGWERCLGERGGGGEGGGTC